MGGEEGKAVGHMNMRIPIQGCSHSFCGKFEPSVLVLPAKLAACQS
jgi:hypothetical protein